MTIPHCTEVSQLERRIAALERELDLKNQVIARQADALAKAELRRSVVAALTDRSTRRAA
jgi:hypothetical protein